MFCIRFHGGGLLAAVQYHELVHLWVGPGPQRHPGG